MRSTQTPTVTAAQTPAPAATVVNGVRVINCNACHLNKRETDFSFKNKATGKRNTKCKPCMREYAHANYEANKAARIAAANQRNVAVRAETRAEVGSLLADVACGGCGQMASEGNDLIVTLPGDEATGGRRLSQLIQSGWTVARIRTLVLEAATSECVLCRRCPGKRCGAQNGRSRAARARMEAAAAALEG